MSSLKKRKHPILDDSDKNDEENVQISKKKKSKNEKKPVREKKKKMKRIVLESSTDEENLEEIETEVSDSINDIKKKAKIRARKLASGAVDLNDDKSVTKSTSKSHKITPPNQKNNILNYFKPKNVDSKDNQQETKKSNKEKNIETKTEDAEGYTYTTLKSYNKSQKTDENLKDSKEKSQNNKVNKNKVESKIEETQSDKVDGKLAPKLENHDIVNSNHISKINKKTKSPKKSIPVQNDCLPRIVPQKRVSELWVDKYKPNNVTQIIGQQGDRSSLNKLIKWLKNWHSNLDKKPGFGKWAADDGSGFRAALLSGPPGVGKTTTAQLVCKELRYDYLELNASDQRNKKSLNENVRDLLNNTKLTDFFKVKNNENNKNSLNSCEQKLTSKHCLIMDEVDGASGNEDRGGIAELIKLIKSTKIPIICICNDRGDQKVRSLINYCYDLRFYKPRLDQIKGRLMSIAFKEKIDIDSKSIEELVVSSNFDIRQCIHNLYLFSIQSSNVPKSIDNNYNQEKRAIKDVRLSPFDAIKKVFSTGGDYDKMSFDDKMNLFFCDYSIMPLFVYENYLSINLSSQQSSVAEQFKILYKSIDSIVRSDMIEKEIRTNQSWSLLPLQAVYSTVIPGSYMRSANGLGFPQFPKFMGKLSTTNKNKRIIDELASHMKLSINSSKNSIIMEYLEEFKNIIINSFKNLDKDSAIENILELMEQHSLTKEDIDSIMEFCIWSGDTDPMKSIDSKIKAAFTRAYNKKDFILPYARDNDCRNITTKSTGKKGKKNKNVDWEDDETTDDQFISDNEDIAYAIDY